MLKRHAPSRQPDHSRTVPLHFDPNVLTTSNTSRLKPTSPVFEVGRAHPTEPRPNLNPDGRGLRKTSLVPKGDSPKIVNRGRDMLQSSNGSSVTGKLLQPFSGSAATRGVSPSPRTSGTSESNLIKSKETSSGVYCQLYNEQSAATSSATTTINTVSPSFEGGILTKTAASCESSRKRTPTPGPVRRVKRRQKPPEVDLPTRSPVGGSKITGEGGAVPPGERTSSDTEKKYRSGEISVESAVASCTIRKQRDDDGDDVCYVCTSSSPAASGLVEAFEGKTGGASGDTGPESPKIALSSKKVSKPAVIATKIKETASPQTAVSASSSVIADRRKTRNKTVGNAPPPVAAESRVKKTGQASNQSKKLPREIRSSRSSGVPAESEKIVHGRQSEKLGEEIAKDLPACPFPGRPNVSWVCRACDGARHHLTSRAAMEPLKRTHGFKVHRVPNDGDCFYSSIMAAVEPESPKMKKKGAVAVASEEGITVAQMRAWVAEEMGEEQLAFYALQAKANPEDRCVQGHPGFENRRARFSDAFTRLDFVRPLDERIPSDDEEEEKEEKEERSSRRIAAKAFGRPHERAMDVEKASGPRGGCGPVRGERGGGKGRRRGRDRGGGEGRDRERPVAEEGETSAADEKSPKRPAAGCTSATVMVAASEREARGVGRSSKLGETVMGKSMKPPRKGVRRGAHGKRRKREGAVASEGGEDQEDEEEGRGEEDDEALPFVSSVEELREFVRLEGSIVGHGRCLWADTFAFHVISRRLGITILFVDMERAKSAWPYRVLARTIDDAGGEVKEERFVLLKREPNHFVLIKTLPLEVPEGATGASEASKKGQACFRRSELPDVVRSLWQIEPKATDSVPGEDLDSVDAGKARGDRSAK